MDALVDTNSLTADRARPSRITTTLYDLISAIQASVESNDDLVVAAVRHILDSGRVTWCDHATHRQTS